MLNLKIPCIDEIFRINIFSFHSFVLNLKIPCIDELGGYANTKWLGQYYQKVGVQFNAINLNSNK